MDNILTLAFVLKAKVSDFQTFWHNNNHHDNPKTQTHRNNKHKEDVKQATPEFQRLKLIKTWKQQHTKKKEAEVIQQNQKKGP